MGLKEELAGKLTKEQLGALRTSFDTVGDIAIIELPRELDPVGKEIARVLVKTNPSIKTVCSKRGGREGEFRLRKLKVLIGKGTETVHLEHGCRFKLDVKKAYFSPREATERQRVAQQVNPGERVLVMFSGIGPFGIIIGKKCPDCRVVQVEINPDAVSYAEENVRLNQLRYQVENFQGDVRMVVPKKGTFDRIVMPLPETAWQYLDLALSAIKAGGTVHLYGIGSEQDLFGQLEGRIAKAGDRAAKGFKILKERKVLPFGSRIWKVCVDFKVLKKP